MTDFGGWEMPLSYADGTLAEHRACREAAVAFDVSHLGTVRVEGSRRARRAPARAHQRPGKIAPGRAQYTHLLDEADASVLDDIIVWWVDDDEFHVMPNASNTDRVVEAVGGDDITATRAVIAIQGPEARRSLAGVAPDAAAVPRFGVRRFEWKDAPCVVAPAPATPARTASSARCPPTSRPRSGRRCSARGSARGPRRARHPAPGGRPAVARPRAGPRDHPAAGGPGLGRGLGQG